MAINYASKYSEKVQERFALASITNAAVNNEYDFVGVNAVNIYSIPTVALGNYTLTGTSRYGTPAELQNSVQTLPMSQDKAFTFTIDRRSVVDCNGVMEAGKALAREVNEVIIPTVDKYRLDVLATGAGNTATAAITKNNAYEKFLDGVVAVKQAKAPDAGRVAYISPTFYKAIRQDTSFIKASDIAQNMLITGQVGLIEGIPLVLAVDQLPTDVEFIITNSIACVSPIKLEDYKVHEDAPGINGWLVEGRLYYDAFVLAAKAGAVYCHKNQ